MRKTIVIYAAILTFCLACQAFALPGGGAGQKDTHVDDMLVTLDVSDPYVENTCIEITRAIDDYKNNVRDALKELGDFGSVGNHRNLYHGGFDRNPCDNPYVREYLDNIRDTQTRKKAEKIIMDGWKKLQKDIVDKFMKNNGIAPSKIAAAKATVALLYDIHILGDYQNPTTEPLINIKDLHKSIRASLSEALKGQPELQMMLDDLDDIMRANVSDSEQAELLRAYLKKKPLGSLFVKAGILKPDQITEDGCIKESALEAFSNKLKYNPFTRLYRGYVDFQEKHVPKNLRAPMNAAIIAGAFSGAFNAYKVIKGEAEFLNAAGNVAEDSGTAASSQYIANGLIQKIGEGKYAITVLMDDAAKYKADKLAVKVPPEMTKEFLNTQAAGALMNYGVATFIFDESRHVWGLARGRLTMDEFIGQTGRSVIKSSASGAAAYCGVLITGLGAANPIIAGIAIGGYILANTGIQKWEEINERNIIYVEDLLGEIPLDILHAKTAFNMEQRHGAVLNENTTSEITAFDDYSNNAALLNEGDSGNSNTLLP